MLIENLVKTKHIVRLENAIVINNNSAHSLNTMSNTIAVSFQIMLSNIFADAKIYLTTLKLNE